MVFLWDHNRGIVNWGSGGEPDLRRSVQRCSQHCTAPVFEPETSLFSPWLLIYCSRRSPSAITSRSACNHVSRLAWYPKLYCCFRNIVPMDLLGARWNRSLPRCPFFFKDSFSFYPFICSYIPEFNSFHEIFRSECCMISFSHYTFT
jgi:hypothetical protein